jgi:hypothetical protein
MLRSDNIQAADQGDHEYSQQAVPAPPPGFRRHALVFFHSYTDLPVLPTEGFYDTALNEAGDA